MLFAEIGKTLQTRVLSREINVKVYFEKMRKKLKIIQIKITKKARRSKGFIITNCRLPAFFNTQGKCFLDSFTCRIRTIDTEDKSFATS